MGRLYGKGTRYNKELCSLPSLKHTMTMYASKLFPAEQVELFQEVVNNLSLVDAYLLKDLRVFVYYGKSEGITMYVRINSIGLLVVSLLEGTYCNNKK